jgi:DNA-binding MarR family transcriptional regulator
MDDASTHDAVRGAASGRCDATFSRLTADEAHAWSGLLAAHGCITQELDAQLRSEHGLTLTSFEVLLHLEAAGGRARMGELTRCTFLSAGGLTRLVDRLAARGLVRRERCPSDARGSFTVLTDEGDSLLRAATSTHVAGVRRHLSARLDPAGLRRAGDLLHRLARTA